jgi:hypothetical protein
MRAPRGIPNTSTQASRATLATSCPCLMYPDRLARPRTCISAVSNDSVCPWTDRRDGDNHGEREACKAVGERYRSAMPEKDQGDVSRRSGRAATRACLVAETADGAPLEIVALPRPVAALDRDGIPDHVRPLPGYVNRRGRTGPVRLRCICAKRYGERHRPPDRNEQVPLHAHATSTTLRCVSWFLIPARQAGVSRFGATALETSWGMLAE